MAVSTLACVWSSEDNLCKTTLFFHRVDSRSKLQPVRLGSKHHYQAGLASQ